MKKLLLVTSVAALSTAAISANAAPKVYGKAFVSADYAMMEDAAGKESTSTQLNSNSSRIGVKGSEDLGNGLSVLYKAEYEINVDNGDGTKVDEKGKVKDPVFKQRNIYIGLSHEQLGTLLAGKMDGPVKSAQNKVDVFNDLVDGNIDMKQTLSGEIRGDDVIAYQTPKLDVPVQLTLGVNLDEKPKADSSNDDRDHGYHAALAYDNAGLYLAVAGAWDAPLKAPVLNGVGDVLRLVGQYKTGGLQLGALYQNAQEDAEATNGEENAWLLSAKYKIAGTKFAVKGQYQHSTTEFPGAKDYDIDQFGLGGEYSFTKATKAHMYFATRTGETDGANDKETYSVVGTGLEHKF